jgi:hypothetical protein
MSKRIHINDVFRYVSKFDHEIGGHYTRDFFFHSVNSQTNAKNGRQFVFLPFETKTKVWHYHPRVYGMWPSFEDLTARTKRDTRSLIFTDVGVWILNIVANIDSQIELLHITMHLWTEFHRHMLHHHHSLSDRDTMTIFKTFARAMREHGYNLKFITKEEFIRSKSPI